MYISDENKKLVDEALLSNRFGDNEEDWKVHLNSVVSKIKVLERELAQERSNHKVLWFMLEGSRTRQKRERKEQTKKNNVMKALWAYEHLRSGDIVRFSGRKYRRVERVENESEFWFNKQTTIVGFQVSQTAGNSFVDGNYRTTNSSNYLREIWNKKTKEWDSVLILAKEYYLDKGIEIV